MKHLFDEWERIRPGLKQKNLLICLDYDGTLTPIRPSPDQARLSEATKKILKELAGNERVKVAVISGRSLGDIKKLIGLRSVIYSGNHGLRVQGPGIDFSANVPKAGRKALAEIAREFRKQFKDFPGVIIEDKKPGITVHYRMALKKDIRRIQGLFRKALSNPLRAGSLRLQTGKMVLEALPRIPWNKGTAVLRLLSKFGRKERGKKILPVYIGDDITDEEAFRALRHRGLTILVGPPRKSFARYHLSEVKDVSEFLKRISAL
ncbi:MAG: trehalose-phosphatase [Candidatus Omnitrophota bacterium]